MRRFLPVGLLALVTAVAWPVAIHAGGKGFRIKISAENLSALDTPPFCGIGPGLVGDKLDVNVSSNLAGITTGTARFEDADGNVDILNINNVFLFFGAIVLETAPGDVGDRVAIWLEEDFAPAHVSVELPGGCANTVSTFTTGEDKVSVTIRVK